MWCSGITSASHAEGPGFKSRRVHFSIRSLSEFRLLSGARHDLSPAAIPRRTYRISFELRSQPSQGPVSRRVGDRLRSLSGAAGCFALISSGNIGPVYSPPAKGCVRRRPYRHEYTGSLSNSEVNRGRALSVGKWGTVSEAIRVLPAFVFFPVVLPRSQVYRVLCAG